MIEFSEYGRQVSFDEKGKTLVVQGFTTDVDGCYRLNNTVPVRRQNFNDDGWNCNVYVYSCPTCDVSLSGYLCVPYCPNCGQHLSWQEK